MILLKCDKCGREVAWYISDRYPDRWGERRNKDLCEVCLDDFDRFQQRLDKEMSDEFDNFLARGEK